MRKTKINILIFIPLFFGGVVYSQPGLIEKPTGGPVIPVEELALETAERLESYASAIILGEFVFEYESIEEAVKLAKKELPLTFKVDATYKGSIPSGEKVKIPVSSAYINVREANKSLGQLIDGSYLRKKEIRKLLYEIADQLNPEPTIVPEDLSSARRSLSRSSKTQVSHEALLKEARRRAQWRYIEYVSHDQISLNSEIENEDLSRLVSLKAEYDDSAKLANLPIRLAPTTMGRNVIKPGNKCLIYLFKAKEYRIDEQLDFTFLCADNNARHLDGHLKYFR